MKDKIMIVTVDGNVKTVEVDKVELWTKMAKATFSLETENIQIELLADMSEILGADAVYVMHDESAQEKNVVASSLVMAQYTQPAMAFLSRKSKPICGDVAVIAWKDDGLMPIETVKATFAPYIRANQLAKAFFDKEHIKSVTVELHHGKDDYFKRP